MRKNRLKKRIGKLSAADMKQVRGCDGAHPDFTPICFSDLLGLFQREFLNERVAKPAALPGNTYTWRCIVCYIAHHKNRSFPTTNHNHLFFNTGIELAYLWRNVGAYTTKAGRLHWIKFNNRKSNLEMMMKVCTMLVPAWGWMLISAAAQAGTAPDSTSGHDLPVSTVEAPPAEHFGRVPAGVLGVNMVGEGKTMFSYTPMFMQMQDNYIGDATVSPQTIATTIPSKTTVVIGGNTVPEMYRIVPTSMDVENHMFHFMYGWSERLNLQLMATYLKKSMSMTTFAGNSGASVLGQSYSSTEGLGDTSVSALWKLHEDSTSTSHLNLGLSLPTGSITRTASMLTPMNRIMTVRASYGMQLGTGTVDILPGFTYKSRSGSWSWGGAYRGRFALGNNSEGYRYGNKQELDLWGGHEIGRDTTATARVAGTIQGSISGADQQISGLMQGSNPFFYGGKRLDFFAGLEFPRINYGRKKLKLEIEAGLPVYQNLNGPQLGNAWQINAALGFGI